MLLFVTNNHAQRSLPEIFWALSHPIAALKVHHIARQCDLLLKKEPETLDGRFNGGQLDAFRHTFYMAAFAQHVRPRKLKKLGAAHEKGNYRMFRRGQLEEGELADSVSCVMDLKNNELGINIGLAHRNSSLDSLRLFVRHSILTGKAVMIKRNNTGNYITCEGKVFAVREKKWSLPKCLVPSNYYPRD